jgi:hypothetical protein
MSVLDDDVLVSNGQHTLIRIYRIVVWLAIIV